MLRMLRSEAETLAAIVRDYRIDLARELSARPGAEVETVATIVKTRMDALRGYEGAPAFQARPDCATASASLSVCAFLCEGVGEGVGRFALPLCVSAHTCVRALGATDRELDVGDPRRPLLDIKLQAINDAQRLPRVFWRRLPAVHKLEGGEGVRPVLLGLGKTSLSVLAHPGTYQACLP
jgi:hypothetical protein